MVSEFQGSASRLEAPDTNLPPAIHPLRPKPDLCFRHFQVFTLHTLCLMGVPCICLFVWAMVCALLGTGGTWGLQETGDAMRFRARRCLCSSLVFQGHAGVQGAGAWWGALVCGRIPILREPLLGPEQPAAISMRVWQLNGQAFRFR